MAPPMPVISTQLQDQVAADVEAALVEAPGEAADQEDREQDRRTTGCCSSAAMSSSSTSISDGGAVSLRRCVGQALQVAGADHGQHVPAAPASRASWRSCAAM